MNQPFLSVIVACYNLEEYVDKCVSSIVEQTYSNLEILLVDDGSTDATGIRCDAWQGKDKRIRVIHKQNEGLAYARKTGVENTTAQYITFVDADDWIDANMYTNMMAALLSTGSDIAQCGVCKVHEKDGRLEHLGSEIKTGTFEIIGRIEGVLLILENDKWHSWMWNKIFKKHLFEGVEYLKGNQFAEDFISHYLFHKATHSVYFSDEYCYYLQRGNSITGSTDISRQFKNHSDFLDAWQKRYEFVEQYPEYHSALSDVKRWVFRVGIHLLRNLIVYPQYGSDDEFDRRARQLCSIPLTRNVRLGRGLKTEFYILKIAGIKCYKYFRTLYVKIITTTNRLKITNRRTHTLLSDFWG